MAALAVPVNWPVASAWTVILNGVPVERRPIRCKLLIVKIRRDVRVVEGARLENDSGDAY